MRLSDAPIRVIADLLAARTGQELTESRLWRVPSALSCVFRERGISNVDQLVCLMADGGDPLLADEVVEALFVEFFINGRDIGDLRVLTEIGAANGLDAQEVKAYLNTDADVGAIHDENIRAHRLGINGVPSFAFNEKFVISGAQEPQVLARMLDAALATEDAA